MLEPDEWKRLDGLLQQALDHPSEGRARWIAEAAEGDAALEGRLLELCRMAEADHDILRPGGALGPFPDTGLLTPRGTEALRPATTLNPGQRLGRYEILSLLGSGGMGRVYSALDPALGREVAIKALAGTFLDDSVSLRRFEREARVLATLSHPNIAGIYGLERHDDAPYLILEKIDGETLAVRLRRGPLPLADAVEVALQVADALEEAHAKGVIHRDLKPSNVMLSTSGRVKVVDFGLAKTAAARVAEGEPPLDPTTEAGAILGTAPYMSPEQVHGKEVDTRTDVWAFGCVVYEMLAGRRAFPGVTPAQVLAAVLRDEPDFTALPANVPLALRGLLQRCLRKDPRLRLQHVGDARVELLDLQAGALAPAAAARRAAVPWRPLLPWAIAALAAAAAGWFSV
ncbi:MAG TPA: serine/threonine-protein kinase, partial [Vicinamibacteria bacterium]|nr:serine/threonine-protein kinase [Vicinamibacteria bacterium]